MKKVIVTGASGFIGKALVKRLLKDNVEVWAIVRDKKKLDNIEITPKLKIIESELKEYKNLEGKINEKNFDIFIDVFHDWNEMSLNSTDYYIEFSLMKTSELT